MRIIIIGCSRIGADLAIRLDQKNVSITVIDQNPQSFERLGQNFSGQTITGVAFDRDVLLKANISHTDALAAVTSNDEINALTARIANHIFSVPRVVSALHNPRKAKIYQQLGLIVFDPMSWGVNRVADLLTFSSINISMSINDVDIVEIEIPPLLVGRKVNDITIPGEISVVSISRGNQSIIPVLHTVFEEHDLLHLAVSDGSSEKLKSLLGLS